MFSHCSLQNRIFITNLGVKVTHTYQHIMSRNLFYYSFYAAIVLVLLISREIVGRCVFLRNLLIFLMIGQLVLRKTPRLEDRCVDFCLPTHPRPFRLGWTFSGTALGVPVRRMPSHHRQGISKREGLPFIARIFFFWKFIIDNDSLQNFYFSILIDY